MADEELPPPPALVSKASDAEKAFEHRIEHHNEVERDEWYALEAQAAVKDVESAIKEQDRRLSLKVEKADVGRILRRYNAPITIRMVLHEHAYAEGRTGEEYRMVEVSDSEGSRVEGGPIPPSSRSMPACVISWIHSSRSLLLGAASA